MDTECGHWDSVKDASASAFEDVVDRNPVCIAEWCSTSLVSNQPPGIRSVANDSPIPWQRKAESQGALPDTDGLALHISGHVPITIGMAGQEVTNLLHSASLY